MVKLPPKFWLVSQLTYTLPVLTDCTHTPLPILWCISQSEWAHAFTGMILYKLSITFLPSISSLCSVLHTLLQHPPYPLSWLSLPQLTHSPSTPSLPSTQGWSEFWPGGFNHLVKTGLNHLILTIKSGQKWSKLTIWAFFAQKIVTNSKINDIFFKESIYVVLLDVNTPIIWQKS